MCGRFSLAKDAAQLAAALPEFNIDPMIQPRYNVAPTQPVVAILNRTTTTTFLQWGLIPNWAKDPRIGYRMINVRIESACTKKGFQGSWRHKRCLIPADGYYEWKPVTGHKKKQPVYFRRRDHAPFMFAGIWDEWHDADGGLYMTCGILTTEPNDLTSAIHHRMPVILPPELHADWLSRDEPGKVLTGRLKRPHSSADFEAYEVSTIVNTATNEVPECIEPWTRPLFDSRDRPEAKPADDLFGDQA